MQENNPGSDSDICAAEVEGNQAPSLTPDKGTLDYKESPPDSPTRIKSNMEQTQESSLDAKADDLQTNAKQPDNEAPTTCAVTIASNAGLVINGEIDELAVESEHGTESNPPMPSESPQDTLYTRENVSESLHVSATETGNEESPDTTSKESSTH